MNGQSLSLLETKQILS